MSGFLWKGKLHRNQYVAISAIAALLAIDIVIRAGFFAQSSKRLRSFEELANLPDVIIYRRTKKTGSSSMLEELLRETSLYGYIPLYHSGPRMKAVVRAEGLKPNPRRLFVAEHNGVTREDTLGRKTIIIDTFVDGYKQMTSHCRFVEKYKVPHCDDELLECLQRQVRHERFYRWVRRAREEEDTYIDIPLSSAHPALSTTAFRHLFPKAVLDVKRRNSVGSACPEDPRIREVYERNYRDLELQIDMLRKRLLALCGYPFNSRNSTVSLAEMLNIAERLEKERYLKEEKLVFGNYTKSWGVADAHTLLKQGEKVWERDANGKAVLSSVRKNGNKPE